MQTYKLYYSFIVNKGSQSNNNLAAATATAAAATAAAATAAAATAAAATAAAGAAAAAAVAGHFKGEAIRCLATNGLPCMLQQQLVQQ